MNMSKKLKVQFNEENFLDTQTHSHTYTHTLTKHDYTTPHCLMEEKSKLISKTGEINI